MNPARLLRRGLHVATCSVLLGCPWNPLLSLSSPDLSLAGPRPASGPSKR